MSLLKTPVTVLQEMMTKMGTAPDYELVAQTGPAHSAVFEIRCMARGLVVVGSARSKKEAKQQAARLMLEALAGRDSSPPSAAAAAAAVPALPSPSPGGQAAGPGAGEARAHVVLLKELCEQYRLSAPEYSLVSDTGPAHMRQFVVCVRVAATERCATASTKKQARQDAARLLYTYLREKLARLTTDFDEDEAMTRALDRVMERYESVRGSEGAPGGGTGGALLDLGQRIADYPLGLVTHIDSEKRSAALECLSSCESAAESEMESALCGTLAALELREQWSVLERGLHVLVLEPSAPPLAVAGVDRPAARRAALRCLKLALRPRPYASHDQRIY